jgi:thiamine transport system ATP-binding protein
MSGLELRRVTVTHPGRPPVTAVRDVSLTVERGEIVALVGPSGCGKSSLLGAIAGVTACAGRIAWDGEDLSAMPVHLRGFGLVFQDGALFPHRTVAGNVAFGLEMARVPRDVRESRVAELLELVRLPGFGTRRITELSGGERQRVALARSLAPHPRLLLLDEPLSSLDAELREALAEEVRDILLATGTTAIVVTHDRPEANAMSSRVVEMRGGSLAVASSAPVPHPPRRDLQGKPPL